MRVVVTGGAGFVGSHLVDRLVAEGHDVVVLDDLSTGDANNLESLVNLSSVDASVELEIGCVTDRELVKSVIAGADRVVHLASTVGVELVAKDPERTRSVIESGTASVLEECRRESIPVLIVSSSEVYGFQPPAPVREDQIPQEIGGDAPRLAYARAKLAADRAALAAAASGAPVLVVRPFNIVGPRQSESGGAVLPRFVLNALAGDDVVVHGDGSQRRCFLDVRDAAFALARLAAIPAFPFAAINLGGRTEVSMHDLAQLVIARLSSRSRVRLAPLPAARGGVEIARRVPDLSRLESIVPGHERHSLEGSVDALARERSALAAPLMAD